MSADFHDDDQKWEWNDILLAKLCKYGVDRG